MTYDLSLDILPAATEAVWDEVKSLSKPLMAMITKTANARGIDPYYLAWVIRSGENWPRLPHDQERAMRLIQTLLIETGTGKGKYSIPLTSAEDAFRDLGSKMGFFKKFLAQAYSVGLASQLGNVKRWRLNGGGSPWSDRDAHYYLHGIIQDELRTGARSIYKPVILAQILEVLF